MKFIVLSILLLLEDVHSLYFKRYRYKICPGVYTGKVLVDSRSCDAKSLRFEISEQGLSINQDGVISVQNVKQGLSNIKVQSTCTEDSQPVQATAVVDVLTSCDLNTLPSLAEKENLLCFDGSDVNFTIFENTAPSILGKLSVYNEISKFTREYFVTGGNQNYLSINKIASDLTLVSPLDTEQNNVSKFTVVCQVSHESYSQNISKTVTINVLDQNDNGPMFEDGTQIMSVLMNDEKEKFVNVIDKDRTDCEKFSVEVFDDPLKICHPKQPTGWFLEKEGFSICRLAVNINEPKEPLPGVYTCNVAFIDTGYSFPSTKTQTDRAILELKWTKNSNPQNDEKGNQLQVRLHKNASKLTQVYRFPKAINRTNYLMEIPKHGLEVTLDGIVYIENTESLRRSENLIKTSIRTVPHDKTTDLFISIIDQDEPPVPDQSCNISCSRLMNKSSCETTCGFGAETGRCVWRHGSGIGIVSKYSTCSPNLSTCPNNECDSLEQAYPALCPQDCVDKIIGTGQINKRTGRGILRGLSQCWCDYNQHCYCFDKYNDKDRTTTVPNTIKYGNKSFGGNSNSKKNQTLENVRVDPVLDNRLNHHDSTVCDMDCKITIATICGCLSALVCLFVIIWKTRKFKCHKNKSLKHVGSTASMSVIPSDYFDDRDYRTTHSSPQYGPYYKESINGSVSPEDAKWEIDRENLQLENTLGEGEFGKVVKAKAYNIDGKETYTDVAVKMLKNCASSVEQQALWSEFNLLKDVQHPNVIRLLGACTQSGPIYLIVEYCEHGSLLCYLRNSRLEENGYVNQRYKPSRLMTTQQREPPELLTIRDLLSFAWQTAKGMQYLSEIKLVHRDLAARNILVGEGKVLKISDFGLTRDVYEADTYLKQSKGRIPVKWLAPESLYAQIYTTQSDVWSFGIVLWEVVTLGAPPYPGVPPERLYNLLLAGYRMDRPENCSDELYAVMQKCWKTDPQDRPTFAKLADIFDKMLQQRTEYLELSGGFEDDTSDLFGTRYTPSVSGISIIGRNQLPTHSENSNLNSRNSGSSYLTPAVTGTLDSNTNLSDNISLKREPSDMAEMASLLTRNDGKNPFLNEPTVTNRAEQTVV